MPRGSGSLTRPGRFFPAAGHRTGDERNRCPRPAKSGRPVSTSSFDSPGDGAGPGGTPPCFMLFWIKTEAPRHDGGTYHAELCISANVEDVCGHVAATGNASSVRNYCGNSLKAAVSTILKRTTAVLPCCWGYASGRRATAIGLDGAFQ